MSALDPEFIKLLLQEDKQQEETKHLHSADAFYRHGFDRTFLFLLSMNYENLFIPWESQWRSFDGWWWKCKGCNRKVKRVGRESHHEWHRKELL